MSNTTELPGLDLDGLEALCKKAPAMWYGTLQIADGVTDDNAALLIEACSPDTVAELVRLARRAQPEGAQFDWMKAERIRDEDHVNDALRVFSEDPTGDNATGVIQAALTVWAADVRSLAQPEGEAPQAEPVMWFEAEPSARGREAKDVIGSMLYSTRIHTLKAPFTSNPVWPLYAHPPAASSSPLCGAQHAESGKEGAAIAAFKKWHQEVGDQDCEYTWLQAWTAAQCAKPASAPGTPEAPKGGA